jgi:hypothetical protein
VGVNITHGISVSDLKEYLCHDSYTFTILSRKEIMQAGKPINELFHNVYKCISLRWDLMNNEQLGS